MLILVKKIKFLIQKGKVWLIDNHHLNVCQHFCHFEWFVFCARKTFFPSMVQMAFSTAVVCAVLINASTLKLGHIHPDQVCS